MYDIKIDNTINRIANVYRSKNIPTIPVSEITHFEVEEDNCGLYILELMDELETLLSNHWIKTDSIHKKHKYYKKFKLMYIENVEDGYLLPRPIIK